MFLSFWTLTVACKITRSNRFGTTFHNIKIRQQYSIRMKPWKNLILSVPFSVQLSVQEFFCLTGITETVAQLASGWVTDRNLVHKYHYHKAYLILCGVVNLLSPLATSYILLMVYAVFFAIFCGGYMALLLPVLVSTGRPGPCKDHV